MHEVQFGGKALAIHKVFSRRVGVYPLQLVASAGNVDGITFAIVEVNRVAAVSCRGCCVGVGECYRIGITGTVAC